MFSRLSLIGKQFELHFDCEHKRWLVIIGVEGIPGKVHPIERGAGEQAALNFSIGLVRARPLSHPGRTESGLSVTESTPTSHRKNCPNDCFVSATYSFSL